MKIAVMGGTPIDTKFGKQLLESNGFDNLVLLPISKNPIEQTAFQSSSKEAKEKIILQHIENLKKDNCNTLFVYCNSLSSSVDFNRLSEVYKINAITPIEMYKNIAKKYSCLVVMAANAHGLLGIENKMYEANDKLKVLGLSSLELVKDIEAEHNLTDIATKHSFSNLINYVEALGVEAIVLGCTHFPYIKKYFLEHTELEIIDVGDYMVNVLRSKN